MRPGRGGGGGGGAGGGVFVKIFLVIDILVVSDNYQKNVYHE